MFLQDRSRCLTSQHVQTSNVQAPNLQVSQCQTIRSQQADCRRAGAQRQLKHIMIIAGETELAETLQLDLTKEGYQVSVVHDGMRGLLAVRRVATDLVIVGWSPPRLSGLEVCDRLRASKIDLPIILLAHSDNVAERIAGLEAGASDCISLPFIKAELFARVHASLNNRRLKDTERFVLRCAGLQLNRKTREVFRGSQLVRLTAKEFDLLEYLMNHYFQVLTRSQILENVWGYEYAGSSNIIEVYIRYLRKKLESTGEARLIHTVRSVGYILRDDL